MRSLRILGALLLIGAVAACSNQKAPAEAALKAAQDAYAPVRAEAQKYVSDQARGIEDGLANAQAALAKNDYTGALTLAQGIPARVAAAQTAISAKKTELTGVWTTLNAGVPQLVTALKSRVDVLTKSRGVPKGLTKETVEAARSGLSAAEQMWNEATRAASAGDVAAATAKGTDVKARVLNLMTSLNMQIPPGIR